MAPDEPTAPPRVRLAPSPTGDPHVGTAYVGLFNWVFARKHGGKFVLRIEDTDRERSSPGSERAILDALRWLGLTWDEGPDCGGPYGPYRQSERLEQYRAAVDRLLEQGAAYRCFCARERLDQVRRAQVAAKAPFVGYDRHCRDLDPQDAARRAAAGAEHVVRLAMPTSGTTRVHDELRGDIDFDNAMQEDGVLRKSDGWPTYHLANVVDDHAMAITHVIRGEEWISSTPKHVVLYRAFGWTPPGFHHLGLLKNPDGSKLSKRKNPVSIFHYRDLGYLPSTFLNFLGTLGFSVADDRDRFGLDEMIEKFAWSRVSVAGGSVFDPVKLDAFSGDDLRALSLDELHAQVVQRVLDPERIKGLLAQAQPRITRLDDFVPYASFFFGATVDYAGVQAELRPGGHAPAEVAAALKGWLEAIETDPRTREFQPAALEAFSREHCAALGWKTRDLFGLLRVVVTGRTAAPSLFETMSLCGKDRVRLRVRDAIARIERLRA
jgi:glutamyl-tRNA synthetase